MTEAQRILTWFKSFGLSDSTLAENVGVTRETINRIRRNKNNCTGETILPDLKLLEYRAKVELGLNPIAPTLSKPVQNPPLFEQMKKAPMQQTMQQPTPIREVTVKQAPIRQTNNTIKLVRITTEKVTRLNSSKIAMKWITERGICSACKNRMGQSYTQCYIGDTFAVLCDQCVNTYGDYIKPIPN
jgi:transcriptional regulator with XRE-family HTH domain